MGDFSPDERYMMYTIRDGGSDEIAVQIMDLATLEDIPDRLPTALYGRIEFSADGDGYYYTHRSRQTGPRGTAIRTRSRTPKAATGFTGKNRTWA